MKDGFVAMRKCSKCRWKQTYRINDDIEGPVPASPFIDTHTLLYSHIPHI